MKRKPIVAGQFYPEDPDELRSQINSFIENSKKVVEAPAKALIVPHAGYVFSGKCAASAYAQLDEKAVFLILGVNHSGIGKTSLSLSDFETPLGTAKNDFVLARRLKETGIEVNEAAHESEHSIEVQLPFLQALFGEIEFVPLIVFNDCQRYVSRIIKVLQEYDKQVIIIASADMTHFGINYGYLPFSDNIKDNLYKLDKKALEFVENIDADGFNKYLDETKATICGRYTISLLLEIMEMQKAKAQVLDYYTSGDVTQDYSNVVGYASVVFY